MANPRYLKNKTTFAGQTSLALAKVGAWKCRYVKKIATGDQALTVDGQEITDS